METGWCQDGEEQQQGAVAGLIAANEINSADHRSKRVDVVKVCLDEDISVVFASG